MREKVGALMRKIRVALFGAGKMAMHHVNTIGLQENASLVAVADPAMAKGERVKLLEQGIEIYTSAEDLIEKVKTDVVHICTPPSTHSTLAKLALQYGAHAYVEKPFALGTSEAMEVISFAKERKLNVCAGHQLLYESPALRADEYLSKLGRVVHIESYFSFKPIRRSRDGRTTISPLDQLVDILPHPVYLLLHFLKKNSPEEDIPVHIRALEVETSGNVHGILRCGDVTGFLVVTLEGRPIESYLKIVGTNGCLHADFVRGTVIVLPGPGTSTIAKILNPYKQSGQTLMETTRALIRRVSKKQKSYPGLFEIISKFYQSLQPAMPHAVSYPSILETVAILEGVEKKLEIAEGEENRIAEKENNRLASRLSPTDRSRGGALITGGTGILGKAVAREVRRGNRYTRVVARKLPSAANRIPGVEYIAADLAENISHEILRDISIVVHCAAETDGGKEAHERNSVGATRNLLEAMQMAGVKKFVHISSIAVLKTSREMGGLIAEDTPLAVGDEERGPYVWGKAGSEQLAKEMSRRLGVELRVIRPGPLVNYNAYEPPGRLGREIGSFFIMVGSKTSKLSLCSIQTAAKVIRKYVDEFESMPYVLNLIEADSPTRGELVSLLLKMRPDLKALRLPSGLLFVLSTILKALQRMLRPGRKPVDIYNAFAAEKYDSKLADNIIQSVKASSQHAMEDA